MMQESKEVISTVNKECDTTYLSIYFPTASLQVLLSIKFPGIR